MKEFKSFFVDISLVGLGLLLVFSPILFFNTVVDPYGIFFKAYKNLNIEPNSLYQKTKLLIDNPNKFDSFIFGSSRVNYLYPQKISTANYYNMTYANGLPKHHYNDLKVLMKNGVVIENLLVGIDYMSLLENPDILTNDLLRKKYPESILDKIEFYSSYMFNMPNWNFIRLAFSRTTTDRSLVEKYGVIKSPTNDSLIDNYPQNHISNKGLLLPLSYVPENLNIDKNLQEIKNIIDFAKENNINLVLFINPTQTSTYLNINLENYFYALKKLSEFTSYYDFSGLSSAVVDNTNFYEPSHYRIKLGNYIIAEIFNTPEKNKNPLDFSFYVTKNNVTQNINRHLNLLAKYTWAHSPNFRYINPLIDKTITQINHSQYKVHTKLINEQESISIDKPILITTPWFKLNGHVEANNIPLKTISIIVKIGSGFFSGKMIGNWKSNTEKTPLKTNSLIDWEVDIPSSLLEEGIQEVNLLVFDPEINNIYSSNEKFMLNVLRADKPILFENLKSKDIPISYSIDLINGMPANEFSVISSEKTLQITGWSFDKSSFDPTAAAIVFVDSTAYISQYLIDRTDLEKLFDNPKLKYAGWGMTIPIDKLDEGNHELSFHFVGNNDKDITPSLTQYQFKKIIIQPTNLIDELVESPFETDYSIDIINGQKVMDLANGIIIQDSYLTLTGWAVDKVSQTIANDVIIRIDSIDYLAATGINRPDVASVFQKQSYINSGWKFKIPIKILKKGQHQLSIKILSSDKKSYFSSNEIIHFITQ